MRNELHVGIVCQGQVAHNRLVDGMGEGSFSTVERKLPVFRPGKHAQSRT